jgi:hypothetical protein
MQRFEQQMEGPGGVGARGEGETERGSERGMNSSFCICILVHLSDIFPQCFYFSDITLYYSSIFCLKQSHFFFQYLQASREIVVLGLEGSVDILLQPLHSVAVCAARVIVLFSLKKLAFSCVLVHQEQISNARK